jgi:hypothetical protein
MKIGSSWIGYEMQNPGIVLVYLGGEIPRYVYANIRNIRARFPALEVTFIHNSRQGLGLAKATGIASFRTSDWIEEENELVSKLSNPMGFRNGFWFHSLARFFALAEFQKIYNNPIIQVECDVWLANNFPFDKFQELGKGIAFPMENKFQGSASILWLRDKDDSWALREYSINCLNENNKHTDMTILGQYIKNYPERVTTLPVKSPLQNHDDTEEHLFTSNFQLFNGIFDALPYGMFLLGSDPRNARGWSFRYKFRKEQGILPRDIAFNFDEKTNLVLDTQGKSFTLYNLHNHSKKLDIWNSNGCSYLSRVTAKQRMTKKVLKSFHLFVFLNLVIQAVRRRLKCHRQIVRN